MLKAVLDTNILVSAFIKPGGNQHQILDRAARREFCLFLSTAILEELISNLHYPRLKKKYNYTEAQILTYIAHLASIAEITPGNLKVEVIKEDPDEEGFTDFDYGEWEGLSLAEVRLKYPELCEEWENAPHGISIPGGESLAMARDRASRALQAILHDDEDELIVIVSHRVICKLLILEALSLPNERFWQIRQDNACMNKLHLARNITNGIVASLNDTCHLKKIGGALLRDF